MLFSRWGRFVYRFRWPVAVIALVVGIASVGLAAHASGELSSGGWLDRDAESSVVAERLATEFGTGRSNLIVLFRSATLGDATSAGYRAAVQSALADLETDERVAGMVGYAETGDRRFVSAAGDATFVIVELTMGAEESVEAVAPLRERIHPPAGLTFQLSGYGPITLDSAKQSEEDLQQAEAVSLPIAAIILILVFASLVAAGMPLLVAGLAIPSSLAVVWVLAQRIEMSIFVLNIATMLGLALAIDYSLFIVSRFREELGRGRTVGEAIERSMATSGKAVAFSGLAVAIGLSGLLVFEAPALRSIGLAGSIVVFCSLLYSLTFLPAVLGMLGPRVNALSLRGLVGRFRPASAVRADRGRWERVAHAVMRRPIRVLVPTLTLLLLAGAPFLRLQQGVPGAEIYPAGLESRDAYVALQQEFPRGETTPIVVLADVTGAPTEAGNAAALARVAADLAAVDGIDRVEGPFSLTDPTTGQPMSPDAVAQVWTTPRDQLPPDLATALARFEAAYVRGSTVRMDAISPVDASRPQATNLIPVIRGLDTGQLVRIQVGGTAAAGHDFLVSQAERAPLGVGIPLLASALVLFLLFGSVVLPIKAVLMTLLSISASFGALVWIFQEGNLSEFLRFEPLGFTIAGNPIIMFCVLFGLSMDYEVLLLSRVQEAYRRTGDNRAAVAEGLGKTAGIITGAAAIMIAVFSAFALADVITIKSVGVGMAIAVFLDATIVRVLLVPATMRLMGRWNWWAPGFLGRLVDRLGFSHDEGEEPEARPEPRPGLAGG
ncbi:MAG TPA: MMPL family transporter [Candidatus Limnocylindrales bacterium]|jgi:RND superfamily putative drug exporter|nr:MMPL family transporter [Candidatus Limnocylindrales bacterium]